MNPYSNFNRAFRHAGRRMMTEDRDNSPKDIPHLIAADVVIMFPFTMLFISITMAGKDRIPTDLYNALCVIFVIAVIGVVIYSIISYIKIREYQKKLREYEQKVQEHKALRKHKPIKRVKSNPAPAKKEEPIHESTTKVVEEPTVIEAPAKAKTTESSAFDISSIPNGKRYPLKEGVLWDAHHQSYLVRTDDTWTIVLFYIAEGKRDPRFNIFPRWRREIILQKDYFDRFTANDLTLILKSVNYGTTPGVLLSSLPMLKDGPVTIPVPEEAIVLLGDGNKAMWREYGVISVNKFINEQIERIDIMETRLDQMIEYIDNTDPYLLIRRIKTERERWDAIFFENTFRILERYYDSEEWHKDFRISKTIRPYMTKKVLFKGAIPDVARKYNNLLKDIADSARAEVPDTQREFVFDVGQASSEGEVDISSIPWPEGAEDAIRIIITSKDWPERSNYWYTSISKIYLEKDFFERFTSEDLKFIINEHSISTAELVSTIPMLKIGEKTIPFEDRFELSISKERQHLAGWLNL